MAEDQIRYDILAQEAMRGVVKKVLTEVMRAGLPGEHHFYITFNTQAPGVRVSSRLRERYPEEMTIVVQHQFWDLEVNNQSFEIGLAFSGVPERLLVPFGAIRSFVDPSVQFGLQFDVAQEESLLDTTLDTTLDTGDNSEARGKKAPGTALGSVAPAAIISTHAKRDAEEAAKEAESTEKRTEKALKALEREKKRSQKDDAKQEDQTKISESPSADVVSLDAFRKKAE